jgi:uncharacterized membrane protein
LGALYITEMAATLKATFVAIYLVVDVIYVTLSMPFYKAVVSRIEKRSVASGSKPYKALAAIASYALMAIGWLIFVADKARYTRSVLGGMAYGALYGLVVYGVFNFTNYVLFSQYTSDVLLRDLAWGVTWGALFTGAYTHFANAP